MKRREKWLLGVCFFVSGATSLVLQIAWSKELSYILGSNLYAVATVVAAFMAGLGIGSALAGQLAQRLAHPVKTYAYLQFGVAVFGIVSIPVFRATEPIFRHLYRSFDPGQSAFLLVRFAAVFLLMLVPVILMGMTLPIVVGAFARRSKTYAFQAGVTYGVNTLGAVVGTLGAGFGLLPWLGLWKTCCAIGIVDGLVGVVALWVYKRTEDLRDVHRLENESVKISPPWTWRQWAVGIVFGTSGAVAMVYEVGWFRLVGLTIGPSVYAFSVTLGMFLLGVGAGSASAARWAERTRLGGIGAMALLEGVLALEGLAAFFYYNRMPKLNFDLFIWATSRFGESGFFLGQMAVAAAVVFAPCFIMGALFPAAVRAVRQASGNVAPEANVGRLYMMNTFGGITGSLLAGFWLVPSVGMWQTLLSASLVSAALGASLWLLDELRWRRVVYTAASLAVAGGLAWATPSWDIALFNHGLYREVYTSSDFDEQRVRQQQLVYHREGINSPVAVYNAGGDGVLRVAGKTDASTIPVDLYTQLFVGHLPVMFARNPRRVAVIGYGSGMSAMSVLTHSEVESLDIIEIERAVIEASAYFECVNMNPFKDSRTNLVLEDGRIHLTHTAKTYDVITSEPSNPWMAGVSNLFTVDFYRRVRERLSPQGVFGQWIQMYEMGDDTFKAMIASLHDVFPYFGVFRSGPEDMVVLASAQPLQIPWETFRNRFFEERAYESFARVDITHPLQLFFYFHGPGQEVKEFVAKTITRNTDDNVWLEYHMPRQLVQIKQAYGERERNIGTALINLGAEHRLPAFIEMIPNLPLEECVRESISYQYSMEPTVVPPGTVIDHWGPARDAIVRGLRVNLVQMGETGVLSNLDRWVKEGETRLHNRMTVAQNLARNSDAGLTLDSIRLALDIAPDLPMGHIALANMLFSRGNYPEAQKHYEYARAFQSSYAHYDALIGLGTIAFHQGRLEESKSYYSLAILRNPYQAIAYRNLALVLQDEDLPAAREVLERGLRFNPDEPELKSAMAELPPSGRVGGLVP